MDPNTIQTLSGITPVENGVLTYSEPTSKAESYLQKKFDSIIKQLNKETKEWNDAHPDEKPMSYQDPVEVNLITVRLSSKFYPFLLILPSSVLYEKGGHYNKDELDIFNPQHTERAANMKKPLYDIVQPFMYDNRDKDAFFSPTVQHELKISSKTAASIKANCRLKVHSFDKGRANYVAVLLDPLRVFHNMAELMTNNVPFLIHINKVEQIKGGNFRYNFTYTIKGGKGRSKRDIDITNQIMRAITNRG